MDILKYLDISEPGELPEGEADEVKFFDSDGNEVPGDGD